MGRTVETADYGTNDNAGPPTRADFAPESSENVLVSQSVYNAKGETYETIDRAGVVSHFDFDDAGRRIRAIDNHQPTVDCDCVTPGNDVNVTTEKTYGSGGLMVALTARNPETGDQVTHFEYGVSVSNGSDFAANDVLRREVYPDATDGADAVTYTYNRLAERTSMTDQNGSVHEYSYDALGRAYGGCGDQCRFGCGRFRFVHRHDLRGSRHGRKND